MTLAVGRLRVPLSFSSSFEIARKDLYEQARLHAARSLDERYPTKTETYKRFGASHSRTVGGWSQDSLNYRTAVLVAERNAVLDVLDGRSRGWRGDGVRVPHWRWRKRRMLEVELCRRNRIDKWW